MGDGHQKAPVPSRALSLHSPGTSLSALAGQPRLHAPDYSWEAKVPADVPLTSPQCIHRAPPSHLTARGQHGATRSRGQVLPFGCQVHLLLGS